MSELVLGIHGLPESGKDTVADHLVALGSFTKAAFADELKAELSEMYGVSAAVFNHRHTKHLPLPQLALVHCMNKEFVAFVLHDIPFDQRTLAILEPRSPRWAMQTYGTDFIKAQDSRNWIRPVLACIEIERRKYMSVVVTDVRFRDELTALRTCGLPSYIMHIVRPGFDTASDHVSDRSLSIEDIDLLLINDTTVAELLLKVDNFLLKVLDTQKSSR